MEHLQYYQRHLERDEVGNQPISPQPQGHAPLPPRVTENTLSDPWRPQHPNVHGASILISPPIQENQFIPAQFSQPGSQTPGYGPAHAFPPLQDQPLSPVLQYGSDYHADNHGSQDRGLPYRSLQHPNQPGHMQRTLSSSTAPTYATRHSHGSIGSRLDSDYKMMGSTYFIPGTVFACLWTESLGGTTALTPQTSPRVSNVCFGQFAYSNIQRFVVILTPRGQQFSLCCPIKTYGHKGTGKNPNTHAQHSMIYTTGMKPQRIQGEKEFVKMAIEVEPVDNREPLDPLSRLNYAKPTAVEHNLRVKHLGTIIPKHIHGLFRSYNEENGTGEIQKAEYMARTAARRREELLYEDDDDDDSKDNENDDEVSLEGRQKRRGRDDDEEPEFNHGSDSRRASRRIPSASSRYVRAEHPHVQSSSHTQTHRGRSNTGLTSRSSPVPFGSPRPMDKSPRRMTQGQIGMTQGQIEAPPPDPSLRKYSEDPSKRDDRRYGSYK